jgi:hypothetical protein
MSHFMSVDGIVPNLILTVVHYALIVAIPFSMPVISFLCLSEQTRLQQDVYKRQIDFMEFFYTNRLDPWWNEVPNLV